MLRIVLKRLSQAVPLILGVIVMNFVLIQLAPGSFLDVMSAEQQITDPAMLERLRVTYGMDQPAYIQLLKYIWSVFHFDFGYSYRQNDTVFSVIMASLPATVLLMVTSIGMALLIGVAAGVIASVKVNTVWDNLVSIFAVFFFAAPTFWLGIMLTILFSVRLGLFPVGGMREIGVQGGVLSDMIDVARHLVLPATTLGLFYAAVYAA